MCISPMKYFFSWDKLKYVHHPVAINLNERFYYGILIRNTFFLYGLYVLLRELSANQFMKCWWVHY